MNCAICHDNPAQPQLCPGCIAQVGDALAELPDLLALAPTWLHADTLTANGPAIGGTEPAKSRPPCELDLLDSGDPRSIRNELGWWALDWGETYSVAPNLDTLTHLLAFLAAWWPAVAEKHPACDEFARDVLRLHRRAQVAMRIHDLERDEVITLNCPGERVISRDGQLIAVDCHHELAIERRVIWADKTDERGDWPDRISWGRVICPRCGTDWSVDRLIKVWRSSGQAGWLPADVIARELGVDIRALPKLAAAGQVQRRYSQWRIIGA